MATLVTPLSLSWVLSTEFGISGTSLTGLSPSTTTGRTWAQGAAPGFVPYNIKSGTGVQITPTTYKDLSCFIGCYYVTGSVLISISDTSASTSTAILSTCGISNICGRVTTSVSKGVVTVSSTWPAAGASTCTVTPVITSSIEGSSTTYSFSSYSLKVSSSAYSNGVFKMSGTTSYAPDLTDSYSGWYASNTTYSSVGVSYNGRRYLSVFVRNRVS